MKILREYCESRRISIDNIDPESNLVWQMSGEKRNFIFTPGRLYPLNNPASIRVSKDKDWTYKVLAHNGFKVPLGKAFFTVDDYFGFDTSGRRLEQAHEFAESLGYPVFVKPNSKSRGKLANPDNNYGELREHFQAIGEIDHVALVQKKFDVPEYRVFVLGDEVKFAYKKVSGKLIGDGKSSLDDLLKGAQIPDSIQEDIYFLRELERKRYSLDSVIPEGQEFNPSPNNNLNFGGKIEDYVGEVSGEVRDWSNRVISSLGLKIAGIDLFSEEGLKNPEDFTILEVNGNPSISRIYDSGRREKIFQVLDDVFLEYFKK